MPAGHWRGWATSTSSRRTGLRLCGGSTSRWQNTGTPTLSQRRPRSVLGGFRGGVPGEVQGGMYQGRVREGCTRGGLGRDVPGEVQGGFMEGCTRGGWN